ncbi:putative baseplate assembly protein [Stenomitos frigidus]|uniref:Putative baseplate assembly protein n=1 Tax=Stenomitos frigidus ULC18 TaxID=2107698 RepID=A0A2T1ENU0_9CYAN|nr:putative baseplate assembly protein [Stenomitos frigidus]PSB34417.1 putative baseplate assembly protein [Stenomitos frigidus ULC18]
MTLKPPKIDPRTYAELVDETEKLAQKFSQWRAADGSTDPGRALIRIFGRMAMMVTDRLNRVPEKHFLAFLNLIGAKQQPPRPARVPLTAYLVDDSPVDALIPAHTQIAAPPQAGETEEVLFETEQDLVVVRSQIKAAIACQDHQYCNYFSNVTWTVNDFPVFTIESSNTIYIAADRLTTEDSQAIILAFSPPSNADSFMTWDWSYWNGKNWQALHSNLESNRLKLTVSEPEHWQPPQSKLIEQIESQWLRGIAPKNVPEPDKTFQKLGGIKLIWAPIGPVDPDQAFFNTEAIDVSQDFFPLGQTPQIGDTFYVASHACLNPPNQNITLTLQATASNSISSTGRTIRWEMWDGTDWRKLLDESKNADTQLEEWNGPKQLSLPEKIASVEVNSKDNYWLRARFVSGSYGSEPSYQATSTTSSNKTTTTLEKVTGTGYSLPSLKSVKFSRGELNIASKAVLKELSSEVFIHHDPQIQSSDTGFYLGFDRPFPNQTIALYLQIAAPEPGALQKSTAPKTPAKLQWEYSVAEGWRSLTVQDGTQNLSQRGMVQFIGPADFASQTLFGQSGYWLRLRLLEGGFQIQPRLQRVLTNTVWAIQATTHQDEILGSGTGDPNLMLHTLYTPVLPGQQLLVREPELPSAEELKEIKKLEGEDAIAIPKDASGQPEEIWVRWHEVSDFYGSGSRDRHYTLDRMTGEIRFGGEGQGLPPPVGRNNIRMACYKSGGGSQGNRAAETLTDLKTTVPYIDRVINHEPASGGADVESIAAVQESGPKQLRHGDRAVTWQDIEDLAYAASSEVARVKVLPPPELKPTNLTKTWISPSMKESKKSDLLQELPGLEQALNRADQVTVFIVPNSPVQQPTPSLALVEQVKRYLSDRSSPTLTLEVMEPPWVQVTVTAKVFPVSLEATNWLNAKVEASLTAFLHPLTGGPQKRGWPFGRFPQKSDIYALIQRQQGVSHVTELQISKTEEEDSFLIYSGTHSITIDSPPNQP